MSLPELATSGIESIVRLWSPEEPADMSDCSAAILSNQQRMQDGPQLLRGINPAVIQVGCYAWLQVALTSALPRTPTVAIP